jgi:hypothetical protein
LSFLDGEFTGLFTVAGGTSATITTEGFFLEEELALVRSRFSSARVADKARGQETGSQDRWNVFFHFCCTRDFAV